MPAVKLKPDVVVRVPIGKIEPDPDQPRKDFAKPALDSLAKSIKEHDVQVPILVRLGEGGQIVIKDGERRWRAAKQAKLKTVPVLLANEKDAIERGLQQVAINQEHAHLTAFELAQFLKKLQDEEKLSPNEIAARLEKMGMKAMSRSNVANLIRLTDLPDWAAELLNTGKLEATAARSILAAIESPTALAAVRKSIADAINWRGKVTVRDVDRAVADGWEKAGVVLKHAPGQWGELRAHFDWKKVCAGCEFLKEYGGGAWCLNRERFNERNAQAKADGLELGGKKPRAEGAADRGQTPAQDKERTKELREQRKRSLERNARDYLHVWLRRRCLQELELKGKAHERGALVLFATLGQPGVPRYVSNETERADILTIAKGAKLENLTAFFGTSTKQAEDLLEKVALELAKNLEWPETQMLAHELFGEDLGIWKVERPYLEMLRKAELAEIADKHCPGDENGGAIDWGAKKVGTIIDAIIAERDHIPPPPNLQKLYEKIGSRRVESFDLAGAGDAADELEEYVDEDAEDLEEAEA